MAEALLVSIVTPTLNRAGLLKDALESVARQGYARVEHIVIDGGSSDGTGELVARFPEARFVSEPDDGIYAAINKGLRLARGEVIGFLNSDDVYLGSPIARAAERFAATPDLAVLSGGARIAASEAGAWRTRYAVNSEAAKSLRIRDGQGPPGLINARFFRRGVFDRIGMFDERFRLASDLDLLIRMSAAGLRNEVLPDIVYEYRQHAGSKTLSGRASAKLVALDECLAIALEHWRKPGNPETVRRSARRLHAWLVGWASAIAVLQMMPLRAAAIALAGLRRDPAWLYLFPRQLPAYVAMRREIRSLGLDEPAPPDSRVRGVKGLGAP
jgi:glycosyltransferase involved in cell wall biosynthesis